MQNSKLITGKSLSSSQKAQCEIKISIDVETGEALLSNPLQVKKPSQSSIRNTKKSCKFCLSWTQIAILLIFGISLTFLYIRNKIKELPEKPIPVKCPVIEEVPNDLQIHQNYIGDDLLMHRGYVKTFKDLQCGSSEDFPWMIKIIFNGNLSCGASLIAPNWAASAAHCLIDGM